MKNPVGRIKTAWFNKLNGALTYSAVTIPVFREDADRLQAVLTGLTFAVYVLIRAGGSRPERTGETFMKRVWVYVQIVTRFEKSTGLDDKVVDEVDEQIQQLAWPTVVDDGLTNPIGFHVQNVSPEDEIYETVVDETFKYHIKTTRWEHLVIEQ